MITDGNISYIGNFKYQEVRDPRYSKSPFGLDTVVRKFAGARPLFEAFRKTLKVFDFTFRGLNLTEWESDDDPCFPCVSLTYKGWMDNIEPKALRQPDLGIQHASASCTSPMQATRDIQYYSPTIRYRYTSNKEQLTPRFSGGGDSFQITDISSFIQTNDGTRYVGSAPAGLVTALTLVPGWKMTGLSSEPEPNTPFYNNEETWALEYLT